MLFSEIYKESPRAKTYRCIHLNLTDEEGVQEFGSKHTRSVCRETQRVQMCIDIRANMVFPELRSPTNAEVSLRQGEEGGMVIIRTVPAELEQTPALRPPCQPCSSLGLTIFKIHSALTMK